MEYKTTPLDFAFIARLGKYPVKTRQKLAKEALYRNYIAGDGRKKYYDGNMPVLKRITELL